MRVAVLLKQVPDTTAKISVSGSRVDESAITKWSIIPYEEYGSGKRDSAEKIRC
jgi:hypothetical protein